jgi:hypothetical protein
MEVLIHQPFDQVTRRLDFSKSGRCPFLEGIWEYALVMFLSISFHSFSQLSSICLDRIWVLGGIFWKNIDFLCLISLVQV